LQLVSHLRVAKERHATGEVDDREGGVRVADRVVFRQDLGADVVDLSLVPHVEFGPEAVARVRVTGHQGQLARVALGDHVVPALVVAGAIPSAENSPGFSASESIHE